MPFRDREQAGQLLAQTLKRFRNDSPLVLGVAAGGVVVAYEVARALEAPLDVWGARSVRDTNADELAIGGRCVLVVDDGVLTGATARAVVRAVRRFRPRQIVVAVPVGVAHALECIGREADAIVCLEEWPDLRAVGAVYEDLPTVADDEVGTLLRLRRSAASGKNARIPESSRGAHALAGGLQPPGELTVPPNARGMVLVALPNLNTPGVRDLSGALGRAGFATLAFDPLTADERSQDRERTFLRFEAALLARRIVHATDWVRDVIALNLPLAYFATGVNGAAALVAAARRSDVVRAVVSAAGYPSLAHRFLEQVRAPVLLIVPEGCAELIESNTEALRWLDRGAHAETVPEVTDLFADSWAIERVVRASVQWFVRHLAAPHEVTVHGLRDCNCAMRRGADDTRREP